MQGGPLTGLTVIEMAGLGPCPLAGQLLADLGAEVVVIDRGSGQRFDREVNRRGKKSIALDLKQTAAADVVVRLATSADVLIEGFRPGVMERLGIGPDSCLAANPALVYGRMTGWGQEGPLASSAGHDINYLSLTGALHAMGEAGRPPVPPLNLVADYGGGAMFLVAGVLAALFERSRSGKGQVVDAAMVDGVPAMMGLIHTMIGNGGWTKLRGDNLLDGGAPFYRCYATSDGKYVSVGALEPQFFAELVEKTGLDRKWLKDRMDKSKWSELAGLFETTFASRTRDEWVAVFEGSDACFAPILDWEEATCHPHMDARGVFFAAGGVNQASPAPRFSRSRPRQPAPASASGGDTDAVLRAAGYDEAAIAQFRTTGVLT